MRLEVCLAAIVPAMIAVWKTGPFGAWISPSIKREATSGGSHISAKAVAVRRLNAFEETSTIAGLLASSRWLQSACGLDSKEFMQSKENSERLNGPQIFHPLGQNQSSRAILQSRLNSQLARLELFHRHSRQQGEKASILQA